MVTFANGNMIPVIFAIICVIQASCSNQNLNSTAAKNDDMSSAASIIISNNKIMNQLAGKVAGKAGEQALQAIGKEFFPDLFTDDTAIDYEKIRSIVAEEARKANIQQTDMLLEGGFIGLTSNLHKLKTEWIDRLNKELSLDPELRDEKDFQDFTSGKRDLIEGSFETQVSIDTAIATRPGMEKPAMATFIGLANLEQNARGLLALMESVLPERVQTGSHLKLMKESAENARAHINKWLPQMRWDQVVCQKSGNKYQLVDSGNNKLITVQRHFSKFGDASGCRSNLSLLKQIANSGYEGNIRCIPSPHPLRARMYVWNLYLLIPGELPLSGLKSRKIFIPVADGFEQFLTQGQCWQYARKWKTDIPQIPVAENNIVFSGLLAIANSWVK